MEIINFKESLKQEIHALYNKNVGDFYKPMSYEYFDKNYFNHISCNRIADCRNWVISVPYVEVRIG